MGTGMNKECNATTTTTNNNNNHNHNRDDDDHDHDKDNDASTHVKLQARGKLETDDHHRNGGGARAAVTMMLMLLWGGGGWPRKDMEDEDQVATHTAFHCCALCPWSSQTRGIVRSTRSVLTGGHDGMELKPSLPFCVWPQSSSSPRSDFRSDTRTTPLPHKGSRVEAVPVEAVPWHAHRHEWQAQYQEKLAT